MANETVTRVQFFERQFLRTQDFTDEQAYHVAMRRRHNIAHHRWGIVTGLAVVSEEGSLFVQPGLAIDVFGRELILADKTPLAGSAFVDKGSEILDVWLVYDRISSDRVPKGYAGCGDPAQALYYRWQERARVRLERPDPAFPDRRSPKAAQPGDEAFDPSRSAPDDPQRSWPVFLGSITRNLNDPDNPYVIDLSGRPYAGLTGEAVVAPSGRARLQIGAETESDPNRFALFVPADTTDENGDAVEPKLAVRKNGSVDIHGDARIDGEMQVKRGAVRFGVGSTNAAQPWRIYRHESAGKALGHELRIEMGGSGGSNSVVIGSWSAEEKKFKPCLTVADDATVTVHGNLVVEGQVVSNELVPGRLSAEAKAFVTGSVMSGITGGSAVLNRFYQRGPAVPSAVARSAMMQRRPAGMNVVVQDLNDEKNMDDFVRLVESFPDLKQKLLAKLKGS